LHSRVCAFLAGVTLLVFSGWASADPPARVARLGYMTGAVSFSPAGESDWDQATINRPLTTGDRLWADAGARAEIQVGGTMIRMNANTGVSLLNLDDRIAQLQLTQGTLNVRVRRLAAGQALEVDTPNLAFTLRQAGQYRIDVDPDRDTTTIVMRSGQGEAYGDGASYVIGAGQPHRFTGTDLREPQALGALQLDEFDRWSNDRDRRDEGSISARYVSPDVVGYQDLDTSGTWRVDATYGNVWTPSRVAAGWAPYRDGHWTWVDPWGWTWVDDAPWGFAVSHYGRWADFSGTWGWVPGPVRTPAYYAPALVVFVGGSNFQLTLASGNVLGVAWFPLGPREVYRPAYPVSRGYFENVNRSNTVINTTVINNTYNNINVTNIIYANRQVPGAVVAVPTTAFVQSQPVAKAAQPVPRGILASAPVAIAALVAPTERSVHGAAAQRDKPPARVFERPVVAVSPPPVAHAGFAAQQPQLAAKPGQPLDDKARKELKPAATVPVPVVKVVAPAQQAPQPLRAPPAAQAPQQRGNAAPQGRAEQRGQPAAAPAAKTQEPVRQAAPAPAPPAPAPAPAPIPAPVPAPAPAPAPTARTPGPPAAQAPQQRGNAGQQGRAEQRGQPAAAPAAKPQEPVQQAAPAPAPAPAPVARTPEPPAAQAPPQQRGNAGQQGRAEQRGQPAQVPAAKPQEPVRQAAPAPMPAPAPAPAARAPEPPVAQPPQPRGNAAPQGRAEQRGQPAAAPAAKPQEPARQASSASAPARNPNEKKSRDEQGGEEDKGKGKGKP
jgi:hypothetical protein